MCCIIKFRIKSLKIKLTMTDLVLHAVLHENKNYHFLNIYFLIKRSSEMKSMGTKYYEINIQYIYCILYRIYSCSYAR